MFHRVRHGCSLRRPGHSWIFFDSRRRRGVLGMHRALQPLLSGNRHLRLGRLLDELGFIMGSLVDFVFFLLRRAGKAKTSRRFLVWNVAVCHPLHRCQLVWPILHPDHAVLGAADGCWHPINFLAHRPMACLLYTSPAPATRRKKPSSSIALVTSDFSSEF